MASAIEIRGLGKTYRRGVFRKEIIHAVEEVSLEVETGQAWALVGPNGAGKTTTLHCLLGLLRPDRGSVRIFGEDPTEVAARRILGFQMETFFTYNYLNARDALAFYGRLSGLDGPDLFNQIDRSLERVGMSEFAKRRVGTFSKGMTQRLGLAQSILHDPELIVWDEPSTGLDPEGRRMVLDLLREMKQQGKTILFSTHILGDVEQVCDFISVVQRGKSLFSGGVSALVSQQQSPSLEEACLSLLRMGTPR